MQGRWNTDSRWGRINIHRVLQSPLFSTLSVKSRSQYPSVSHSGGRKSHESRYEAFGPQCYQGLYSLFYICQHGYERPVQLKMKKGVMVITVNLAETSVAYVIFLRWKTIAAAYMRDIISKKHFASVNDPVHQRDIIFACQLFRQTLFSELQVAGNHHSF